MKLKYLWRDLLVIAGLLTVALLPIAPAHADDIQQITNLSSYNSGQGVVKLHNGVIITVFRNATAHMSTNGIIMGVNSTDNGETWGKPYVIYSRDGYDAHMPSITQFFNGTYWTVIVAWMEKPVGAAIDSGCWTIRGIKSLGGGYTSWGTAYDIIDTGYWHIGHNCLHQMREGYLGLAIFSYDFNDSTPNTAYFLTSWAGNAGTWFTTEVGSALGLFEPAWIETKNNAGNFNGSIYMMFRNQIPGDKPLLKSVRSWVYGGWSEVQETGLYCALQEPVDIIRLADGSVYCVYARYANPYHGEIRLAKAVYEGNTLVWQDYATIWTSDQYLNSNYAYASLVDLGDSIGTVIYCGDELVCNLYLIRTPITEPVTWTFTLDDMTTWQGEGQLDDVFEYAKTQIDINRVISVTKN